MPELPEVETIRRNLAGLITGSVIRTLRMGDFEQTLEGARPEQLDARLRGRTITGVERRAKLLLLKLDTGETLTIHLRMTGELTLVDPELPSGKHFRFGLIFVDGRELRFNDVRKFGRIRLLSPSELAALDGRFGPEPLDPALTPKRLVGMLARHRRAIKPLLLDQAFIAGVGNIYADEALFLAGIHPLRAADSLTLNEAERLLQELRVTLRRAIGHNGTTIRNYRNGLGVAGENQRYLYVYGKQSGESCPRCGGPLQRLTVGQRGTTLCPTCQPLPQAE